MHIEDCYCDSKCERTGDGHLGGYLHTGWAAIENVNTIDERRSKTIRNRVFDWPLLPNWRQIAIENIVASDFDPGSSIVKSLFDYRLPDMILVRYIRQIPYLTLVLEGIGGQRIKLVCPQVKMDRWRPFWWPS